MLPTLDVTPYGAVQVQDFHTPAYSESDPTGGGFGLSYNAMNATDVRTEVGSRFDAPTIGSLKSRGRKPCAIAGRPKQPSKDAHAADASGVAEAGRGRTKCTRN